MTPRAREVVLVATALAAGLVAYLPTTWLMPAAPATFSLGVEHQLLSAAPFEFGSRLPQRILGPLLAWAIGLGGEGYPRFTQSCSVLLLAAVFWFCRGRGARSADALLITLAVACSGTTQTYKALVGFSDPLTFALLLVALRCVGNAALFWAANFLSLLNHEFILFFMPWLLWERRRLAGARLSVDALALALVSGLYVAFRWWIAARAPHGGEVKFDLGYYIGHSLFPFGTLWLCIVTLVYWVADFGPLLVVIAWGMRGARPRGENASLLLLVAGIGGIYTVVFAYDFERYGSFLFLPLVTASLRFLADPRRRGCYALLVAGAAVGFTLWHPSAHDPARPPGYVQIGGLDGATVECLTTTAAGTAVDYGRAFACLLPRVWTLLLGVAAELALLCGLGWGGLGWWAARRSTVT